MTTLYKYRGMLKDGKNIRGKIEAKSKSEAVAKLKASKITPIEVKKSRTEELKHKKSLKKPVKEINLKGREHGKKRKQKLSLNADVNLFATVKPKDILVFTNNLYILKKSNFNNVQALESLYYGTENPILKDIIEDMLLGVEEGEKMYQTLQYYPKIFPLMYVNFVRVGEESGSLGTALMQARDYVETSMDLKKKIQGVLIPKIVQFFLMMIALGAALLYGVPMIENVYAMFGSDTEIPEFTMLCLNATKWILSNWYIVAAVIGAIVGTFFAIISTPRGKFAFDKWTLNMPVFGKLLTNLTIFKFFQAMLLNIRNGMRIQESLEVSKNITNNYYVLSIIETSKSTLIEGGNWIDAFEESGLFPVMALQMLKIGMETDIAEMMEKVNEYINMEINESIEKITKVLPEISYAILGVMIIIFVLAVLVPVMEVYMGNFLYEST